MPRNPWLLVLGIIFLVAACASSAGNTPPRLTWKDGAAPGGPTQSGEAGEPAEPADPRASGEVIQVSSDVMKDLMDFVNRSHFLIADRIEVDASRVPFQMAMVPVADPAYVDSVEMSAVDTSAIGLMLKSKSATPMVDRDFPRLRFGDGMDLVAVNQIAVRTWGAVKESRPMFLTIRGFGHAVYRDEKSGRKLRQDQITVVAEAVPGPGGLVFRSSVE